MKVFQRTLKKVKIKISQIDFRLAIDISTKEKKKDKVEVNHKLEDFSKIYTGLKNYLDFDFLKWKKLNERNDTSSLNDNNCCIFFLVLLLFVRI